MIKYPILSLNLSLAKKESIVLSIAKPVINSEKRRLKECRKYIHSKFCDSNGHIYILTNIHTIGKSKNLWTAIVLNNFKLLDKVQFEFTRTNESFNLEEFKKIVKELIKIEIVKEAHEEYFSDIEKSESFEDMINNFWFACQE